MKCYRCHAVGEGEGWRTGWQGDQCPNCKKQSDLAFVQARRLVGIAKWERECRCVESEGRRVKAYRVPGCLPEAGTHAMLMQAEEDVADQIMRDGYEAVKARRSDQVTFIACTNRKTDMAGVTGILEPVKSRFISISELTRDGYVKTVKKSKGLSREDSEF